MYGRALRLIRIYHDLSQTELADRLSLSKSYVSEIEKGSKKPSIDVLERYGKAFDLPLSQILIFAEAADQSFSERTRAFAAGKALQMLEWCDRAFSDEAA